MPPMYVNVGAYVDEGTMIDSHALVGSCAQVGKRVHLSAGAQLGGVLEPVGALPVIVEDDVLIGGNCGVYEGSHHTRGCRARAGHDSHRRTVVLYDLVRDSRLSARGRPAAGGSGRRRRGAGKPSGTVRTGLGARDLQLYAPVIVKYRDDKTELSTRLEELLR